MGRRRSSLAAVAVATLVAALLGPAAVAMAEGPPPPGAAETGSVDAPRPAVFVHGFMGSASQFESQAMRLASNGYPVDWISAFEYDSMALSDFALPFGGGGEADDEGLTMEEVHERLDDHIARVLADTGAEEVDLLGHSMGTGVSQSYLDSGTERADQVAHYVNLDGGGSATDVPGGVPTLAIWSLNNPEAQIPGATNVTFADQGHTEVVSSTETFAEIHAFLTGGEPATTRIEPQPDAEVTLAGRATIFPDNVGAEGATLEIHELDPSTGERLGDPVAAYELDASGDFGPFDADAGAMYEYLVTHEHGSTHRIYRSPSPRTNHLIRLQTSEPDGIVSALTETSTEHATLTVSRDREWWGDQGEDSDALEIDGHQVLNAATAPQRQSIIGVFAFDAGSDGETNLDAPVGLFALLPFLTGVDVHLPGAHPPEGSFVVASQPRGGGHGDRFVVPGVASEDADGNVHAISVHFDDHHQSPLVGADPDPDPPAPVRGCPDQVGPPPFADVAPDGPHAPAIACGAALGLVRGVTPTTFEPRATTTRGQYASLLARTLEHAGHELPAPDHTFEDVPQGHVHQSAIEGLAAAGIVAGRTPERFAPGSQVERAQAASMLVRALAWALDEAPTGPPAPFADRDRVPAPHVDAVDAAVAHGLILGREDGTFQPRGSLRRDQAASVVVRLLERVLP